MRNHFRQLDTTRNCGRRVLKLGDRCWHFCVASLCASGLIPVSG